MCSMCDRESDCHNYHSHVGSKQQLIFVLILRNLTNPHTLYLQQLFKSNMYPSNNFAENPRKFLGIFPRNPRKFSRNLSQKNQLKMTTEMSECYSCFWSYWSCLVVCIFRQLNCQEQIKNSIIFPTFFLRRWF